MNLNKIHTGRLFLFFSLMMLILGVLIGVLASQSYLLPGFLREHLGFISLRPMHVSSAMFWILLGATGCVYCGLQSIAGDRISKPLVVAQLLLWCIAIVGIFYSYTQKKFGGREYWEFDPVWALPIAGAWLLFMINFFRTTLKIPNWPVYIWMWMTGLLFFLFSFTENYLWLLPYFREHFVTDMTIQWKVNGSLVGAWNQLLYGTAFFMMDRIQGKTDTGQNKLAFAMYFLGLFNLMFNWGHHIYTLPTAAYVRYIGYGVSMTEWIIFARIVYQWKNAVSDINKNYHYFPYRFLMAADIWVFINLGCALLMSVPALNIYTHGTHVTVAHAMGTTIGINSMIILAACFEFFGSRRISQYTSHAALKTWFWLTQFSLLVFFIALNGAGIQKGLWQMSVKQEPFTTMMDSLKPWFVVFAGAGVVLMISLTALAWILMSFYIRSGIHNLKRSVRAFNLTTTKETVQ